MKSSIINKLPLNLISKILKIIYIVFVVAIIYIVTILLREWGIGVTILKIINIISPVLIGIVLAWTLNPLVRKIEDKGVKRITSTIIVYVLLISFILIFILIMVPLIFNQINELVKLISNFLNNSEGLFSKLPAIPEVDLTVYQENILEWFNNYRNEVIVNLPGMFINLITKILFKAGQVVIGLIVGFYFILHYNETRDYFYHLIPNKYVEELKLLFKVIGHKLYSYVKGTLIATVILTIMCFVGFVIGGLKAPLLFAIFCAVVNVIPYIGALIGGVPTVLIAFSQNYQTGVIVLIAFIVIQVIYGNFLMPLVMKKTMKLQQVTMLIGLIVFGYFFGIIGMVLATPVIALFKILFKFTFKKLKLFGMESYNLEEELT